MGNASMSQRGYLYFFVWFIGAGLQNVVPQMFFSEYYPERQNVLLSVSLLLGAVSSVLTIFLSRSPKEKHLSANFIVFAAVAISLLFISLFLWLKLVPFIIAFLLLCGIVQYVYNRTDHYYVRMTEKKRYRHTRGRLLCFSF